MELRCEELTRGSGEIYIRVGWNGVPSEDTVIDATVTSRQGEKLPVVVMPLAGESACVVILAIFTVVQQLTVRVENADGVVLGTLQRRINPTVAMLTSRFNTLRKNKAAEAIRNVDRKGMHVGVNVECRDAIFHDDDGIEIVHATARILGETREEVSGKVTVRLFDEQGRLVNDGAWIPMGDACNTTGEYHRRYERVLSFSIQIPPTLKTCAFWVTVGSGATYQAAILCLQAHEVWEKRMTWGHVTDSAQTTIDYDDWFIKTHRTPEYEFEGQRAISFDIEPTFSIIVPVYKTPLDFFREMVESVLGQTYAKLELILVNASPEDKKLSVEIERYAAADERVRVVAMESNLGIVGNTYAGVDVASGDFISFFDHDDVLEPDLLFHYVEGINDYPTTDLLYCDEDKLQDGVYTSPYFKPDWSPDLLCCSNYVCHMLTVRKTIVDELPREGIEAYEGSQDHYLTLFAGERARNVFHARKVLYHWRMHAQSTAANVGSKSYTEEAGIRAVQAHLDRCGIAGTARSSGVAPNTYHVDYELASHPLVSIIIPNKDMVPILSRCIDSILERTTYPAYEIVIVENNSTEDETFAYYREVEALDPRIKVVVQPSDGVFNFSRTINYGAANSTGDYLLLLNNDTEVLEPRWIDLMMGLQMQPHVGIVGAKLLYPDGLIQHAGVLFHKGTGPIHAAQYLSDRTLHYYCSAQLTCDLSAVTGACLLTSRDIFNEVGGLDEVLKVDYNDVDYCLKVRELGYNVVYEPEARLMHYESISRGGHRSVAQQVEWCTNTGTMMQKWQRYYVVGDPYCNPSLGFSPYHVLQP